MDEKNMVDDVARALHAYWLENFNDPNRDFGLEMRDACDSHLTNSPSVVASWWRSSMAEIDRTRELPWNALPMVTAEMVYRRQKLLFCRQGTVYMGIAGQEPDADGWMWPPVALRTSEADR